MLPPWDGGRLGGALVVHAHDGGFAGQHRSVGGVGQVAVPAAATSGCVSGWLVVSKVFGSSGLASCVTLGAWGTHEARRGLDPARLVTEAAVPMRNAAVSSRAACVARCRTTADVQAAVRIAHALGLPLAVFSGGNDWLGRAVRDRGLVIDVSAMSTIEVDVEARTARIGGGVRSDALARETESHGLTPVTGTVGLVHMLGLSLGGGYGPLDGRFGLACDNLVAAELVTADGAVRTVDGEYEPDLLWALRGGGGNFGVVTAAVVRLHRIGPVYSGMVVYPWSQAASALTRLDPLLTSAPDELSAQTIITSGRDGTPLVAIMPTWSGGAGRASPRASVAARHGGAVGHRAFRAPGVRAPRSARTRNPWRRRACGPGGEVVLQLSE
ncbi:FAD-binding oxidoreductase [Streptomyces lunalinharesii]|uniref:FAD-binding PCMH-type domain-containing protein n=1 Tax=Streptomyces lunalinharesii TaxID=333384 RepID=A0ABP6FEQ9_9ACTN